MRQLRHSARAACRPQGPNGPGRRLAQYRACASADRPGKLWTVGMTPTFLRRRCHVPPPQPGSTTGHLASGGSGRVAWQRRPETCRHGDPLPGARGSSRSDARWRARPSCSAQHGGQPPALRPAERLHRPGGPDRVARRMSARNASRRDCVLRGRTPGHPKRRTSARRKPRQSGGRAVHGRRIWPSSLRSAYHLPSGRGHGRVVAIVDAYDDPKAESNLAHYRRNFGLPACTAKNGCFRKVNQRGGRSYPRANAGWAAEISLDLDMVSATCPKCHILLVEASSADLSDLGKAVNTAVRLGARYVSNSYGAPESASDTSYDSQYYNHTGVAITASAGDDGYGSAYPADSRYVTAVGGTSLRRSSSARGWSEKAWHGTGSGCSAYDAKPSWQGRTGCGRRAGNDVAAVADPNTGVAVYDTFRSNGWQVYGGTSAAAPIIAAAYALAGKPRPGTYPASYAYTHRAALHDVTSGRNGSCGGSRLCRARAGYDGPTGLGTPNGVAAFRAH